MNNRLADLLNSYDCGIIVLIGEKEKSKTLMQQINKKGGSIRTLDDTTINHLTQHKKL